jgi:hypothetical protein
VAEAFRKGYSYRNRLLRPALVKVAKGEEETEEADQAADAETEATDS